MTRITRILVVEDNPGDAELIRVAIETHVPGSDVTLAEDGESALEYLRERAPTEPFDMVILDWRLPGMGGVEVLDAIRLDPAVGATPVIVLTGSDSPRDASLAYEHSATAYLSKVLDVGEVLRANTFLCGIWHALLDDEASTSPAVEKRT